MTTTVVAETEPVTDGPMPNSGHLFACDFEVDLCDWTATTTSPAQWTRHSAYKSTYGSAPLVDHTLRNSHGHYAFVNLTSSGIHRASLISPRFQTTSEMCLDFWYQVGGPRQSVLFVGLRKFSPNTGLSSVDNTLWITYGNQASTWSHAYVRIRDYDANNQLRFDSKSQKLML